MTVVNEERISMLDPRFQDLKALAYSEDFGPQLLVGGYGGDNDVRWEHLRPAHVELVGARGFERFDDPSRLDSQGQNARQAAIAFEQHKIATANERIQKYQGMSCSRPLEH